MYYQSIAKKIGGSYEPRPLAHSHFNFSIIFLKAPPATLVSLTEHPRPGGAGGIDGPAEGGEEYANICSYNAITVAGWSRPTWCSPRIR